MTTPPPGQLPTPLSGDHDTFDVIDDAITTLGLQRGLWMGDSRNMIHLVASLTEQAHRCLPELVADARDEGCSWQDIATLLGTSPEQAQLLFDPDSPVADRRWMLDI
jgi:hypothetical protein